jgi:transcription initiation factor TFIID subunit TAF12
MTTQGQEQEQQGKLPPFMFVSKIAKISNDKYYINIPKAMWPDVQQYQQLKQLKITIEELD